MPQAAPGEKSSFTESLVRHKVGQIFIETRRAFKTPMTDPLRRLLATLCPKARPSFSRDLHVLKLADSRVDDDGASLGFLPSLFSQGRPRPSTRRLVVVTYRRIDRVGGFGLGRCGNCAMKDPSSKCAFYRAPLKERPQMPRCSWTISRPWESNREGICKGVFGDDLYLSHIASCSVALM